MYLHMYLLYLFKAFKTKDGYLVIGAGSNQQFAVVCKVIHNHQNGWMADSTVHFFTNWGRVQLCLTVLLSVTTSVSCVNTWKHTAWSKWWGIRLVNTPLSWFPSFFPFCILYAYLCVHTKLCMWRYPSTSWVLENFCCCFVLFWCSI